MPRSLRALGSAGASTLLGAALLLPVLLSAGARPAGAQVRRAPLPPAAVVRIPATAARPALRTGLDAPLPGGEFASEIRTPADRLALADGIARRRARENRRWAKDGPGIAVPLRRSRY